MHILQSWKESITLFKPSNFKLFFLVSLRAFALAIKTMCIYWGWLILFFWTYDYIWPLEQMWQILLVDNVFRAVLLFLVVCSLRATASLKNYSYFMRMFIKVGSIIPVIIGLYWINTQLPPISAFWDVSLYLGFSVVLTVYLAFVMDSDGHIKSLVLSAYRAFKMVVYNLPWFIIIALVFTILELVLLGLGFYLAHFSDIAANIFHDVIQGLLYGLQVTMIVNFYTKRLYEQIELYFVLPS